jgi:hypothetical protein
VDNVEQLFPLDDVCLSDKLTFSSMFPPKSATAVIIESRVAVGFQAGRDYVYTCQYFWMIFPHKRGAVGFSMTGIILRMRLIQN